MAYVSSYRPSLDRNVPMPTTPKKLKVTHKRLRLSFDVIAIVGTILLIILGAHHYG